MWRPVKKLSAKELHQLVGSFWHFHRFSLWKLGHLSLKQKPPFRELAWPNQGQNLHATKHLKTSLKIVHNKLNYDKIIWLLIPPKRISTKPGEASLKSAGHPSILPDQKKGWLMKTPVLPVQLGCFQQMCIYRRDQQCTELLQWQASKKKKRGDIRNDRLIPTNQPKRFWLEGVWQKQGENLTYKYQRKNTEWNERHYFWDEVEIMRLVPRKLLNSLLLTQEVSFLFEKKVHQAILIHRSKPNWIHQSNFRVCFLKKPSLPNHHWPWDPTWAPYTSTTFWQKKASI